MISESPEAITDGTASFLGSIVCNRKRSLLLVERTEKLLGERERSLNRQKQMPYLDQ